MNIYRNLWANPPNLLGGYSPPNKYKFSEGATKSVDIDIWAKRTTSIFKVFRMGCLNKNSNRNVSCTALRITKSAKPIRVKRAVIVGVFGKPITNIVACTCVINVIRKLMLM